MKHYILDERGEPLEVSVDDDAGLTHWALWYEHADRVVKQERIGKLEVSTVFLARNHRFRSDAPPILWETVVFGSEEEMIDRCSGTREQAEAMHARMVAAVRAELCARMCEDLGRLLDRGDPPTFETRREMHGVLKVFFGALGRPWPTWEELCARPDFVGGPQDSGPPKKSPPRGS